MIVKKINAVDYSLLILMYSQLVILEFFGYGQTLNKIITVLILARVSLLSLGFGSSYLRFYSRYKAQKDDDGVARLNGMFMVIFCTISVICVLCGIVMLGNIRSIFGAGLTESEYATAKASMY